jgi:PPM family protein phosphatase
MVVYLMSYKVFSAGVSDIGLVRENNEDVWAKLPLQRFFAIADGMGGHQAGEVAARESVNILCSILSRKLDNKNDEIDLEIAREIIVDAVKETNSYIYQMGCRDLELNGMGTTLCFLYFHPKGLVYGHVGDSRIYRLRNNKLTQITKDHSLLRELVDQGQLDEQQAGEFVYKHIITKAIGTGSHVEPSVRLTELYNHDVFLMCTDGLSDLLTQNDIESILNKKKPLKELNQELIDAAKQHGGHDNITVVLTKVQEIHERKDLFR